MQNSPMRIFVAGATGAIGRQILPILTTAGHEVTALTRSADRKGQIKRAGANPVVGDALDGDRMRELMAKAKPDVVVAQLTAIPPRIDPRRIRQEMAPTTRLRTEAMRTLIDAAREVGVRRLVTQSIAFGYAPRGPGREDPATEAESLYLDAPAGFADLIRAVEAGDRMVLDAPDLQGMVLRYGLFYGPGTAYANDGSFAEDVRNRKVPIVGRGEGVFSFVHVVDAAAATWAAVERGAPGIYHVVDDEPVTAGEWLPWYATVLGAPPPRRVPTWLARLVAGPYVAYFMTQQRGAVNDKARHELGWEPRYPSWRDGMAGPADGS